MAYVGQTHTVAVPLPVTITGDSVTPPTEAEITAAFEAAYRRVYSRLLPGGVSRILNLRTAVIGKRPKFDLATLAPTTSGPVTPRTTRRVHMGGDWCDAAIYDRLGLPVGTEIHGPAVLEQPDTTILVEHGLIGSVDAYGNVILTRGADT
jgi:N-methylhydantoinase A